MKKSIALVAVLSLALCFSFSFSAQAKEHGKVAKNVGRVICSPLKAVGEVVVDIGQTVTFQKPLALLDAPKEVRQGVFDTGESVVRAVAKADPIPVEDVGALNTAITDAGVDWLVDGVFYAAVVGPAVHNGCEVGSGHHDLLGWKAAFWSGTGVAAADIASGQLNK